MKFMSKTLICMAMSFLFFLLIETFGASTLFLHMVKVMYQNVNQGSEIIFRSSTFQKPFWWLKEYDDENITRFSTVHYFNFQLKQVKIELYKTNASFVKGAYYVIKKFCEHGYSKQTIGFNFQMLSIGQIEFGRSPVDVIFCQEGEYTDYGYGGFYHEASNALIRFEPYAPEYEQYYFDLIEQMNILIDYDHAPEVIKGKRPNYDL